METGTFSVPDPRNPARLKTVGFLRVVNLHQVIQDHIAAQEAAGLLVWPPNVPPGEIWIEVEIDKGGSTTMSQAATDTLTSVPTR